jgi:hypothetical protein
VKKLLRVAPILAMIVNLIWLGANALLTRSVLNTSAELHAEVLQTRAVLARLLAGCPGRNIGYRIGP